jgi:hypothetical protein
MEQILIVEDSTTMAMAQMASTLVKGERGRKQGVYR